MSARRGGDLSATRPEVKPDPLGSREEPDGADVDGRGALPRTPHGRSEPGARPSGAGGRWSRRRCISTRGMNLLWRRPVRRSSRDRSVVTPFLPILHVAAPSPRRAHAEPDRFPRPRSVSSPPPPHVRQPHQPRDGALRPRRDSRGVGLHRLAGSARRITARRGSPPRASPIRSPITPSRLFEVTDLALRTTTLELGDRPWDEAERARPLWERDARHLRAALPYVGDLWLNDAHGPPSPHHGGAFPTPDVERERSTGRSGASRRATRVS